MDMNKKMQIIIMSGIIIALCFINVGCISFDDDDGFDISDTVIEGEYIGRNEIGDFVIKIIRVEKWLVSPCLMVESI